MTNNETEEAIDPRNKKTNHKKGQHVGHRRMMKRRLIRGGFEVFSPHEVIEFLLFFTKPQMNVNPLAHVLMDSFGCSFANVIDASYEKLCEISGVGEHVADFFTMLPELFGHCIKSQRVESRVRLDADSAAEYLRELFSSEGDGSGNAEKKLVVALLNSKMELIKTLEYRESEFSDELDCRRGLAEELSSNNAYSFIMAWNDPENSVEFERERMYFCEMYARQYAAIGYILYQAYIFSAKGCKKLLPNGNTK